MPLPQAVRRLTPDRLRDDPRLRAVALGAGLIPPRTMHSDGEAATLARLASGAHRVVELGVYEGSSAVVLVRSMAPGSELVLVDPYTADTRWAALPQGAWANATATRLAVARARRAGGPTVRSILQRDHGAPGGSGAFHAPRAGKPGGHGAPGPTRVVDEAFRSGDEIGWTLADE